MASEGISTRWWSLGCELVFVTSNYLNISLLHINLFGYFGEHVVCGMYGALSYTVLIGRG